MIYSARKQVKGRQKNKLNWSN